MKLLFLIFIFVAIFATTKADSKKCKANEVYKECGSSCSDSCDRIFILCPYQCEPGCYCVDGYCRSSPGRCILYPW
ncbi:hypothetical protein ACKWTF_000710 [Chironomus riparius]